MKQENSISLEELLKLCFDKDLSITISSNTGNYLYRFKLEDYSINRVIYNSKEHSLDIIKELILEELDKYTG